MAAMTSSANALLLGSFCLNGHTIRDSSIDSNV